MSRDVRIPTDEGLPDGDRAPARARFASRRWLASAGAVTIVAAGLVTSMTVTSPASAAVDPYGPDARFISLVDHDCRGFYYKAEGFMSTSNDPAWHTWEGSVACGGKAVFAWNPADRDAVIYLTIHIDGELVQGQEVPGDQNYCLALKSGGDWKENWSSDGGGGSGSCTAD